MVLPPPSFCIDNYINIFFDQETVEITVISFILTVILIQEIPNPRLFPEILDNVYMTLSSCACVMSLSIPSGTSYKSP